LGRGIPFSAIFLLVQEAFNSVYELCLTEAYLNPLGAIKIFLQDLNGNGNYFRFLGAEFDAEILKLVMWFYLASSSSHI